MRQEKATSPESSAADAEWARLVDDYLARRAAGEVIGPSTFGAEHPEGGADLRGALSIVDDLCPPPDPLELLCGRGVLRESTDDVYRAYLADYGIVGVRGVGGMGVVLEAYDPAMQRTVAIKLLHPMYALQEGAAARFRREAHTAARLQHPNVVTVHAVGQSAGVPFLVMEYVAGGVDLRQLLRSQGPLATVAARQLFGELLSGLAAAHGQGVMHRDIKPANILLTPAALVWLVPAGERHRSNGGSDGGPDEPCVKIADFGLARCTGELAGMTAPGALLGTPECMSPEQLRGGQDVDERTDLYSAGVVAYHMLTGRAPFEATTIAGTLQRIVSEEPPTATAVNAQADPVLSSIARRLMSPAPEDRFQSANETLAALRAERPVRCVRPVWSRRRCAAWLTVVVVLAAAVLLVVRGGMGEQRIRTLDVDPETNTLRVWYSVSSTPTVPPGLRAPFERLRAAVLLDLDGHGTQRVAVGPCEPSRTEHVHLLDPRGRPTQSLFLGLCGEWPGFSPDDPWVCQSLAAGPLDAEPGDELVVATSHQSRHPSRVAIVNPRTTEVRASLWHPGHVDRVAHVPHFFGTGQPGIFAHGCNGEPNAFPCVPEEGARTKYDVVYVYMILDPQAMVAAEAPPQSGMATPPPGVYAYAFLDMPIELTAKPPAPGQGEAEPCLRLASYRLLPPIGNTPGGQRVQLGLEDVNDDGVALLTIDGNLKLVEVQQVSGAKTVLSEDFLRSRWRRRVVPPAVGEE